MATKNIQWKMNLQITPEILKKIFPAMPKAALDTFPEHLNYYMPQNNIDKPLRVCAFLAQIGHESGQFRYTKEIWGPTKAQDGYEGREDLGNIHDGDGKKFMGRGLIQLTGRANYEKMSKHIFGDNRLESKPELLSTPMYATQSACVFWALHGLNERADAGQFKEITKRINGGLNGYAERLEFYNRALQYIV